MSLTIQEVVTLITALGVVLGLYSNWQRDRNNERKIKRDELAEIHARVVAERDELLKKLEQAHKDYIEQGEIYKARLAERDETILNLSRKVAQQ